MLNNKTQIFKMIDVNEIICQHIAEILKTSCLIVDLQKIILEYVSISDVKRVHWIVNKTCKTTFFYISYDSNDYVTFRGVSDSQMSFGYFSVQEIVNLMNSPRFITNYVTLPNVFDVEHNKLAQTLQELRHLMHSI